MERARWMEECRRRRNGKPFVINEIRALLRGRMRWRTWGDMTWWYSPDFRYLSFKRCVSKELIRGSVFKVAKLPHRRKSWSECTICADCTLLITNFWMRRTFLMQETFISIRRYFYSLWVFLKFILRLLKKSLKWCFSSKLLNSSLIVTTFRGLIKLI